jgi:flagellar biosynthetic protein FliR
MIAQRVAASFALGLQMAAPFLIFGMAYYIGLGLLGRLMPQLQVFFIGIPLQISLQIWVMMLTLSGIMMVFLNRFSEVLSPFAGL